MAIFEPIKLSFGGRDYQISADAVMRSICEVENVLTFGELNRYQNERGTVPLGKLAAAYGALLRCAGANVSDDEIYVAIFAGGDATVRAGAAVATLLMLMIPPSVLKARMQASAQEDTAPGKPAAGASTS